MYFALLPRRPIPDKGLRDHGNRFGIVSQHGHILRHCQRRGVCSVDSTHLAARPATYRHATTADGPER